MLLSKILILFISLPVLSFTIYVAPRTEDLSLKRGDKHRNATATHLHVIKSEPFHHATRSKRCVDLYHYSNNSINTVLIYFSVYRLVVQFQFNQATDSNFQFSFLITNYLKMVACSELYQLQVQLQCWQTQHTKVTMCCSKRAKSRLCQHVYILVTTVFQPII